VKGIRAAFSAELEIKKSRFLAELIRVSSQEEARSVLKSQKEKYTDASHVVHAFVIGPTGGILGCSDDGEPSGTAGRPVLDVLKGSGITDVILTVTRWFGGTLLGTGGLVKAYGDSAKEVLFSAETYEIVPVRFFSVSLPYDLYERIKRDFPAFDAEILSEKFGTGVDVSGKIPESRADEFAGRIRDLSSGRITAVLSE
jgi:uncharacterized YigZ family protein